MIEQPRTWQFDGACDEVVHSICADLKRAGLQVSTSFDLRSTTMAGSPCPEHGPGGCGCQLVVLLVYGREARPAVAMVHGNQTRARLALIEGADLAAAEALSNAAEGRLFRDRASGGQDPQGAFRARPAQR